MEPTTKKWKTEKLKSKKRICSEVSVNSQENHVVSHEDEKEGCLDYEEHGVDCRANVM